MPAHVLSIVRDGIAPSVPAIAPDDVVRGPWSEQAWSALVTTGGLAIGSWHGEPGALRITDQPYDELSVIQAGRVAIVDEAGERVEYGPGDGFVLRAGFSGIWETLEPSDKIYAILAPGAADGA